MRIVKKKKVLRIDRLVKLVFIISLFAAMGSSLFLRSYNNSLTMRVQSTEDEIATLKAENDAYKVAIQDLSNKERVLSIAEMEGMAMNQGNVVTINYGE